MDCGLEKKLKKIEIYKRIINFNKDSLDYFHGKKFTYKLLGNNYEYLDGLSCNTQKKLYQILKEEIKELELSLDDLLK